MRQLGDPPVEVRFAGHHRQRRRRFERGHGVRPAIEPFVDVRERPARVARCRKDLDRLAKGALRVVQTAGFHERRPKGETGAGDARSEPHGRLELRDALRQLAHGAIGDAEDAVRLGRGGKRRGRSLELIDGLRTSSIPQRRDAGEHARCAARRVRDEGIPRDGRTKSFQRFAEPAGGHRREAVRVRGRREDRRGG